MNNITSMVTASRNANVYDDISSLGIRSLRNNSHLSAVTRLRYDYRSDGMCLKNFADMLFVMDLLYGATLHVFTIARILAC